LRRFAAIQAANGIRQAGSTRPAAAPLMSSPPASDLLLIAASNGENLRLAQRFASAAAARGQRTDLLDLTTLTLPLFTPRAQAAGTPPALAALERQLASASRWLICAPEYNGSIPPVLTSAIAWLSVQGEDFRSLFNRRPVAIASHSGGGGSTALAALRLQLAHLGADVVGRQLLCNPAKPARDESIEDLLDRLLGLAIPGAQPAGASPPG
jgi:NAD(P)H-dependent FMN reductase